MAKHEKRSTWIIVLLALLVIVGLAYIFIANYMRPHVTLRLGDGVFRAELARTSEEHIRGLSGHTALPSNHAMLFVFDHDAKHKMWMQGMRMDIDIVWLDSDKEVVHIVRRASPDSYPNVFKPETEARYVVELASAVSTARNIHVGMRAEFDLDEIRGMDW